MKVYISADIEGITGTSHWDETEKTKLDYNEFREHMLRSYKCMHMPPLW